MTVVAAAHVVPAAQLDGGTLSITVPAAAQEGDLLVILQCGYNILTSSNWYPTGTDGFSQIPSFNQSSHVGTFGSTSTNAGGQWWYKIAQASDLGRTVTFTWTGSQRRSLSIFVVRDGNDPSSSTWQWWDGQTGVASVTAGANALQYFEDGITLSVAIGCVTSSTPTADLSVSQGTEVLRYTNGDPDDMQIVVTESTVTAFESSPLTIFSETDFGRVGAGMLNIPIGVTAPRADDVVIDLPALSASGSGGAPPFGYWEDVLALSPTLYWRFNEPGTVSGLVVQDSSGNGYTGQAYSSPFSTTGLLASDADTALSFTGSARVVITKIFQPTGPDQIGSDDKTVSILVSTTDTDGCLVYCGLRLDVDTNGYLRAETNDAEGPVTSLAPINDGNTHHVAATYKGTTKEIELFVDGVSQGTNNAVNHPSTTDWFKVPYDQPNGRPLTAVCDEAVLWADTALDSATISALSDVALGDVPAEASGQVTLPALSVSGTAGSTPVTGQGGTAQLVWDAQAGTLEGAPGYMDMEATLPLSVNLSAALEFLDPAAVAAIGETRPVQVEIWDKAGKTKLAVLDGRYDVRWLEDHNDAGTASFTLSRFDPKTTVQNLSPFNIVRFRYAGRYVFASRIEKRRLIVSSGGDFEAQEWKLSGRGLLGALADAVLYPEYEVNPLTRQQRAFSFASKIGSWYDRSEWFKPQGMKYKDVPNNHPWKGLPEDWPDKNAQWIWSSNPNRQSDTEATWFRTNFTTTSETEIVSVFMTADDASTAYIDGYPVGATSEGLLKGYSTSSIKLPEGEHLLAVEVTNTTDKIPETTPETISINPNPAGSGNMAYVGRGFSDGGAAYVNGNGSVRNYGTTAAAFDGNANTIWMSVGNYSGWSSAYEYVEGTFGKGKVTAVRINVHGGPYDVYISLKNGSKGWNGSRFIPYRSRVVNAGNRIRYVKKVRVPRNGNVLVPIPAQVANRIRITGKATWNSGFGAMPYRFALKNVKVTGQEGIYVRGGNYAGLLLTLGVSTEVGKIDKVLHRSKPSGWLCKKPPRPGWLPAQILHAIIEEGRERGVLGLQGLKTGFTPYVDSYGKPWPDETDVHRRDKSFRTGDDILSVTRQIVEDAPMDVWIDYQTLTLHAAPERGKDLGDDVMLRPGHSLTDFEIDSDSPSATHLLVESEYGWLEAGVFDGAVEYGRVEGTVSYGNALSLDEARKSAENELESSAIASADASTQHTDVIGPRPWIDYRVGDTILMPLGFGENFVRYKVLSISAVEGEAGELKIQVDTDVVDPADLYTSPELTG